MRHGNRLVLGSALIAVGCAARDGPADPLGGHAASRAPVSGRHVISIGQRWADAQAAARSAGYRLNDARGLEWASPGEDGEVGIDGFYLLLPGDTDLIVFRDPETHTVAGLHLQGNTSKPKMHRTHRDPGRSFELRPREGR